MRKRLQDVLVLPSDFRDDPGFLVAKREQAGKGGPVGALSQERVGAQDKVAKGTQGDQVPKGVLALQGLDGPDNRFGLAAEFQAIAANVQQLLDRQAGKHCL